MNQHGKLPSCPSTELWMEFTDPRAELETGANAVTLQTHLDNCAACTDEVEELRRFNTMLLRTRVTGLTSGQWSVLDERMEMMGSEHVPPPKIATKMYFGVAMAAAIGLVAVGVWQFVNDDELPRGSRAIAAAATRVPSPGTQAGLSSGAVDGHVEISDATGAWQRLGPGQLLRAGTRIRAMKGPDAARIVVPGHFELRVSAGTELQFLAADERHIWLRLRDGGEVSCQVEKRRPNQQFKVLAGRFRASVVGTEFVVQHNVGGAGVSVVVSEGAVRVDEANSPQAPVSATTALVRAGTRWRFTGGQIEIGPTRPDRARQPRAADVERAVPSALKKPEQEGPIASRSGTTMAAQPATSSAVPKRKRRRLGGARSAAGARPSAGATRPSQKTHIVEIDVPPKWHDAAHQEELRRLEKLGRSSSTTRVRRSATATPKSR